MILLAQDNSLFTSHSFLTLGIGCLTCYNLNFFVCQVTEWYKTTCSYRREFLNISLQHASVTNIVLLKNITTFDK
jgi:hypothetical protein